MDVRQTSLARREGNHTQTQPISRRKRENGRGPLPGAQPGQACGSLLLPFSIHSNNNDDISRRKREWMYGKPLLREGKDSIAASHSLLAGQNTTTCVKAMQMLAISRPALPFPLVPFLLHGQKLLETFSCSGQLHVRR